jgi:hypothetical protein
MWPARVREVRVSKPYHSGRRVSPSLMMVVVSTFADLPLERRATAALNVIFAQPFLSIAERHELVFLALFPSDVALPGPVSSDQVETAAVDRPRRRVPPPPIPRPRVSSPVTDRTPLDVQTRYRAGASIAELAEEYGVEWLVARRWANTGRG